MNNRVHVNAEKVLGGQKLDQRKKFLWFTLEKVLPVELISNRECIERVYTEEEMLKSNSRLFKRRDLLNENSIWEKAQVEIESVDVKYTNNDVVLFEKDSDALAYLKEFASLFSNIKVDY